MAQSLEVNIKTTSDVPQAMDKAKTAVSGLGAQIEGIGKKFSDVPKATEKAKTAVSGLGAQIDGIGKKFSTSFKDIFLSFLGPMAILTTVIGLIGKMIADNQRKQQEANQAAIDGTNNLMSAEDNYYANKRANEQKTVEDTEQANKQRIQTTLNFIKEDPRGGQLYQDYMNRKIGDRRTAEEGFPRRGYNISLDKEVQDKVQALIAEDIKKNPQLTTPKSPTSFRGPEGFSNVVGVGANPVIEAMTLQLEEARKQTALLESLNSKQPGGGVPVDFTKTPSTNNPSLRGGK
jgi:hypothetical protein